MDGGLDTEQALSGSFVVSAETGETGQTGGRWERGACQLENEGLASCRADVEHVAGRTASGGGGEFERECWENMKYSKREKKERKHLDRRPGKCPCAASSRG
jgi:hypothetical protein